jgi:hypothetical protein
MFHRQIELNGSLSIAVVNCWRYHSDCFIAVVSLFHWTLGLRGSLPDAPHLRNRRIATGLDLAAWVKHQNAQVSMGFKSTFRMTVEWRNLGHTEIARHCYVWMFLV